MMSKEHFCSELFIKKHFSGESFSLEGTEIRNLKNLKTEVGLGNLTSDVGFVYNENKQGFFEYIWSNPISFTKKFKYWEKNKLVIGINCNYEYRSGILPQTKEDLKTLFKARMFFINNPYSGIQFWDGKKSKTYKIVRLSSDSAFYLVTDSRSVLVSYSQINQMMMNRFKTYCNVHQLEGYIANIKTKENYKEFIRKNELKGVT